MNKNKIPIIIAAILLFLSFNCLALAAVFYKLEDKAVEFRYSDTEEYNVLKEGNQIISKLPIQFNIINRYFSNFDNLDESIRQKIIMSYVMKNRYKTYACGIGNNSLCVKQEDLNSEELLNLFHTQTKFEDKQIKIYFDDYGPRDVTKEEGFYKVELDNDNQMNKKYSRFSHYKQVKDSYVFYVYEGYYKANCKKGEILELHDFLTGDVVYSNICNESHWFSVESDFDIEKLQLYKYEFKKNDKGQLYISGYNPVHKKAN